MKQDIKAGLKTLTYGLYIVTVNFNDQRNTMVASWVSQVSYEPPRIMVAVKKTRLTHTLLLKAASFGLMVVQRGKERELPRFKGDDPGKKFDGQNILMGKSGTPLLLGYLAAFDLTMIDTVDAGDHTIFIGEVTEVHVDFDDTLPATTLDYGKVYIGKS
jgi:flavin reductase (DIM6/NTAB) family NADH-FMN oxidoreductase RutF